MEMIEIANELVKIKKQMNDIRAVIKNRGIDKANASSEYERVIAVTIVRLKNLQSGATMDVSGEVVTGPVQATLIEKIARGICYDEKLKMETTDALYKSAMSNLNVLESEKSTLQTLLKRFDNI